MAAPSSTLLTIDMITNEAVRVLHQNLTFVGNINRQYDSSFAKTGAKIGDTLRIRKPVRHLTNTSAAIQTFDGKVEQSSSLAVTNQYNVNMEFTSKDMSLSIDDFSNRFIKPAMAQLAASVDYKVMQDCYKYIPNLVLPVTACDFADISTARQIMTENLAPMDDQRFVVMCPTHLTGFLSDTKALFNSQSALADQYLKGQVGQASGFKFYECANVPNHLTGTLAGTSPVVNGASQTGTSLITDGWGAAATLKAGDVLMIANVAAVNYETRDYQRDSSYLRRFAVTANATADGSGNATLSIYPGIYAYTSALATVYAIAADDAAITEEYTDGTSTLAGNTSYIQSIAGHKDSFAFATADLEVPRGVDMASRAVYEGISLRIVKNYDINNDSFPCRVDVLFGSAPIYPETAVRILGAF